MSRISVTKPVWVGVTWALVLLVMYLLPFEQWLAPAYAYFREGGVMGMAAFILAGTICALLFVPITVPVAAAGLLYGFPEGMIPSFLVLACGTMAGFGGGRLFRIRLRRSDWFHRPVFQAVCRAVEEEGYALVALLRMTPFLHFMSGNLFFGTLRLRFRPYLFFSLIGMLPGTALVVYGGSIARSGFVKQLDVSRWQAVSFGLGLLLFIGITWRVTRRARRLLHLPDGDRSMTSMR